MTEVNFLPSTFPPGLPEWSTAFMGLRRGTAEHGTREATTATELTPVGGLDDFGRQMDGKKADFGAGNSLKKLMMDGVGRLGRLFSY